MILLWVPAALACGEPTEGLYASEPVGWTADGRWFAFRGQEIAEDGELERFGVIDTRTDTTTLYTPAKFEAWRSEHPLEPVVAEATCGQAKLVVRSESLGNHPDIPVQTTLRDGVLDFRPGGSSWLTLGIEADGRTWTHAEIGYGTGQMPFSPIRVRPAWSPGCRFVGWVLENYAWRTKSVGPYQPDQPAFVRPGGPVIHIMAHASLPAAVEPILEGLTKAGYAPHVGPNALKDRDATVIYASAAARDIANTVAAAVPGGATVDALTWPSPADIVVAAGRTAAP